ncbi:MAG: c-type cytochrome [Paracoccaceae bacterium]
MLRFLAFLSALICAHSLPAMAENQVSLGRDIYNQHCAGCHGQAAKGGKNSVTTGDTSPPNLKKIAERRGSVWPMLEVMSIIDGYTNATDPRDGMPVINELSQGKQIDFDSGNGIVVSAPENLVAVVSYLESIQSPKPRSYVP